MGKTKAVAQPDKFIKKVNNEIDDFLAKARAKRKWYRKAYDFCREVLTKRVAFAILRMFNKQKPKKETIKMEKTKTNKSKKALTVKVSMLVPYAIITAVIIAAAGIWVGISYEKNRVAEINTAVETTLSKTAQ